MDKLIKSTSIAKLQTDPRKDRSYKTNKTNRKTETRRHLLMALYKSNTDEMSSPKLLATEKALNTRCSYI